jgi:hypothetical protein
MAGRSPQRKTVLVVTNNCALYRLKNLETAPAGGRSSGHHRPYVVCIFAQDALTQTGKSQESQSPVADRMA